MLEGKVAIVGAGPAGTAAAVQLARYGIAPLLFDAKGRAGGLIENAYAIENFPSLPSGTSGPSIAESLRTRLRDLNIDVIGGGVGEISKNQGGDFTLISLEGAKLETGIRAILVSAGTSPTEIGAEGAESFEGRLLFYEFADIEDPRSLSKTAVIGSGDAAFDYALSLRCRFHAHVELFIRSNEAKALPSLVNACERDPDVGINYSRKLTGMEDKAGRLLLRFDSPLGTSEYQCDLCLAAAGRRSTLPSREPTVHMDDLSPYGSTNIPRLFVAGDIRRERARQLAIAMGDGTSAAMEIIKYLEGG